MGRGQSPDHAKTNRIPRFGHFEHLRLLTPLQVALCAEGREREKKLEPEPELESQPELPKTGIYYSDAQETGGMLIANSAKRAMERKKKKAEQESKRLAEEAAATKAKRDARERRRSRDKLEIIR